MQRLKKCIVITLLLRTLTTTVYGEVVRPPCSGYAECRRAPYMTGAAIILGAAAITAMVAVVVTSANCSHSHCN